MFGLAVLFIAAAAPAIVAAGEDPWAGAAVKPGVTVVVMETDGRMHRGRVLAWSGDGVALETESGRVEIGRDRAAMIRAPGPRGRLQTVYAPWTNLAQTPVGHEIRVVRTRGLPVSGAVFGIREDGIQLTRGRKLEFIAREEIRKVRIRAKSRTDLGMKIGATAGFVTGLFLLMAGATSSDGLGPGAEDALEKVVVGGGKAGTAFDRLFDEYQTIYVAPQR